MYGKAALYIAISRQIHCPIHCKITQGLLFVQTLVQTMIHFSQAAIGEVHRLKAKQHNLQAVLRLEVQPGGCSDLYYVLRFDDSIGPDDQVLESKGLSVVVDSQSLNCLSDLRVDYSEDLMGGGFRFHNPNATQSCGCGSSFSVS
jgi:iron-sulfur cluster assembly protein